MKHCAKCDTTKSLDDFTVNRTKKDGRNPTCKECHRKYTRQHYEKNKPKYIERARNRNVRVREDLRAVIDGKKNRPCMDCGESYPPYVMDFDHARGVKIACVSHMRLYQASVDDVLTEIEKCDVVCSNCHRERTHRRRNNMPL